MIVNQEPLSEPLHLLFPFHVGLIGLLQRHVGQGGGPRRIAFLSLFGYDTANSCRDNQPHICGDCPPLEDAEGSR